MLYLMSFLKMGSRLPKAVECRYFRVVSHAGALMLAALKATKQIKTKVEEFVKIATTTDKNKDENICVP